MRRRSVTTVGLALTALLAAVGLTASQASSASPAAPAVAEVDPTPAQTVDGFGASGAWWPNDLVAFPGQAQQQVADLLFSSAGIDLSTYRYNIGGGGVGVSNPTRAPQSFLVQPGVYDWSRDPGGMQFLRLAQDRGVPNLVGFANSAPPPWTTNGKSCGGQLTPGDEAAYATYLATVARHLHDADGITLSDISPMNEPDNSFSSCAQEGMAVPVSQRAAVVQAVGKALAGAAPYARVIADESSLAYFQFLPEVPQWLSTPGTAQWVAALVHHAYEYPTDAMAAQVGTIRTLYQKPLWMTEICCYDGKGPLLGFGQQYDPTMTSGMWLADTIWQDLDVIGDSAFDWWTAVSPQLGCDPTRSPSCVSTVNGSGWNDGLLYYDPNFRTDGNYSVSTTKRFYVMGNFSRYVRPGSTRHDVRGLPSGLRALAFSQGGSWTVVVLNDGAAASAPASVQISLPDVRGSYRITQAVRTSATEDLTSVPLPHHTGRTSFVAQVPGQSVTTYTFGQLGPTS